MKLMMILVVIGAFGSGTGGLGYKKTGADYLKYSIIKIGQNTEKSPGDLRKLTVIQTTVYQQRLVWKTL